MVLVILASVAITLSLGNNGIFNKTKYAKQEYLNAKDQEETELAKLANSINNDSISIDATRDNVTISKAEYDFLKSRVMTTQKKVFTINLPSTEATAREAGIYYANSISYEKYNETCFNDYFTYENGVGWTVKKGGNYTIYSHAYGDGYSNSSTFAYMFSYMQINDTVYELWRTCLTPWTSECSWTNFTLNEGDVINFALQLGKDLKYNYHTVCVYARFE